MTATIFITNGDVEWNQTIAIYYLNKGYNIILHFRDTHRQIHFKEKIRNSNSENLCTIVNKKIDEMVIKENLEKLDDRFSNINVLIHGNEMFDEKIGFLERESSIALKIKKHLNDIFIFNKAITTKMVKQKKGNIIYPIIYDVLNQAGYQSSPILNNAKISLMKSLSRELTAFKININVMTFGYYDNDFDRAKKKEMKNILEIFSLKPQLLQLTNMIPAMDILVEPPVPIISGENIHIGAGIESHI